MHGVRVGLIAFVAGLIAAMHAMAQEMVAPADALEPKACVAPPDDGNLGEVERNAWSDCEKWAWSCISSGSEANLFTKECLKPRTKAQIEGRKPWKLAPFLDPDRLAASNLISPEFLSTILNAPRYRDAIPPIGIRIFGAYFAESLNLENQSIAINLVLDGSIFKRGLRLTNFQSKKNLSFDGSNVRGPLFLMRARIDGSIYMEYGAFDTVDLRDARIGGSFEGAGSVYNNELRFDRARIEGKLVLMKSRLTMIRGANSNIDGTLDMRIADIRLGMDLTGVNVGSDALFPDLTFGRRPRPGSDYCDWDAAADTQNLLNQISKTLPFEDSAGALREAVETRPSQSGETASNSCETASKYDALNDLSAALLRNMNIDGTLCLVDVSGEIQAPTGQPPANIQTISLDGTVAKTAILQWKKSDSQTLWHAVNFKAGHVLANLEHQPRNIYLDDTDFGAITFLTRDATETIVSKPGSFDKDEELLKTKCDVTPVSGNTASLEDRAAQDRIIEFFGRNTSRSVQPFANVVQRLDTTGVDTTRLKIGLSDLKLRNSCASSVLTATWRTKSWSDFRAQALNAGAGELYLFLTDGICSGFYSGLKYSVAYGHQPLNLIFWGLGLIALLCFTLLFDKRPFPGAKRFGPLYAFDNLIPVKLYRTNRKRAEEKPARRWLRWHLFIHRVLGVVLAVLAFFYIYRASK